MKIFETPLDQRQIRLIEAVAGGRAAALLDIDRQADSPYSIMVKVNEAIVDLVFERPTLIPESENPIILLASLWGEQMARQFQWYWAEVVIDNEFKEVAMISPNREMIIFPFSFVEACINKQCICTILLAFNMLLEDDRLGGIPAATYENIMLSIHHIVPPYTLDG